MSATVYTWQGGDGVAPDITASWSGGSPFDFPMPDHSFSLHLSGLNHYSHSVLAISAEVDGRPDPGESPMSFKITSGAFEKETTVDENSVMDNSVGLVVAHTGDEADVTFSGSNWTQEQYFEIDVSVKTAQISVSSEVLTVGEKDKVQATVTDDAGNPVAGASLQANSSDTSIFSVESVGSTNADGKADIELKGVAVGTTGLNVTDGKGASATANQAVGHHQLFTYMSYTLHTGEHALASFVVRKANNQFASGVQIDLTDLGATNGSGTGFVIMDETSITTAANGLAFAHMFGKKPMNGPPAFTENFKAVIAIDPVVLANPIVVSVRPVTVVWDAEPIICNVQVNGGSTVATAIVTDAETGAPVSGVTIGVDRQGDSPDGLINFSAPTQSDSEGKVYFTVVGTLSAGKEYAIGWKLALYVEGAPDVLLEPKDVSIINHTPQ